MSALHIAILSAALIGVAATAQAQQPAAAPDGANLWREHCRSCHGANGVPPESAKEQYDHIPTMDSTFVASLSDDSLMAVLRLGAGRGRNRGRDMRPFTSKMNAAEMHTVIDYLRTLANRRHAAH